MSEWIKLAVEAAQKKFPEDHPQRDEFIAHVKEAEAVFDMSEERWLHRADMQGMNVVAKDFRQHKDRGVSWVSWSRRPDLRYACGMCGYDFGILGPDSAALCGLVETDDLCSDCHEQKQQQS